MNKVGFLKRITVIVYDGLLLVGVTMVGYALLFALLSILPAAFDRSIAGKTLKVVYLLSVSFCFYGWFWTHGGQTLGMKVWNLYLVDRQGKFITWKMAALRYATALLSWLAIAGVLFYAGIERWYFAIGLGFTWIIFDKNSLAWHDILTGTKIVYVAKDKAAL